MDPNTGPDTRGQVPAAPTLSLWRSQEPWAHTQENRRQRSWVLWAEGISNTPNSNPQSSNLQQEGPRKAKRISVQGTIQVSVRTCSTDSRADKKNSQRELNSGYHFRECYSHEWSRHRGVRLLAESSHGAFRILISGIIFIVHSVCSVQSVFYTEALQNYPGVLNSWALLWSLQSGSKTYTPMENNAYLSWRVAKLQPIETRENCR